MLTFTNQAALTYRNRVRYSNLTTGQIADALTVAKEALIPVYGPEDDVTYVVRLTNNGAAPLTDLTLSDDLGGYDFDQTTLYPLNFVADSLRYYVNGVEQPAPAVTPGAPLVISGIAVPAGGNALIVYEASVTEYASPASDGSITNTVTVSGAVHCRPRDRLRHRDRRQRAGADHRQGPIPRDRRRGSAGDLHLHHRKRGQRRHQPGGSGDRHGHLRPGAHRPHRHPGRGAPRPARRLHL